MEPARDLRETAHRVREHIVDMCAGPEGGHLGGSLSLTEILTVLYFQVLRVDPRRPDDPGRDILLLSKGHGAICLYAVLAERGFLPVEELATYARAGSRLMGHPIRAVPGVEMPTGSLGHGLALGNGFALAGRRCFVVLGDGELQEGSVWEAAGVAAGLGLGNLTAVVDRNTLQLTGPTEERVPLEPLAGRWRAFGWEVRECDGHDPAALLAAFTEPSPGRPVAVIAHTVKGRGLPALEGTVRAHYANLGERQHQRALAVLRARHKRGAP
ncbi:MAG: transketolase [Streptosporangiales bacterium]|nr:transketolase [Streptosporangiales bacterium]